MPGLVLRVFRRGFVLAAAVTIVVVFFRTRTAPDENGAHAQDHQQRKELLQVHAGNIAAIPNRANGIFRRHQHVFCRAQDNFEL